MNIVFITPAPGLRRIPFYRWGGKIYGQSNSVTGPLILGGILKRGGHHVEVYEELNGGINMRKLLKTTDVFCFSIMTSNAPRAYDLGDQIHRESGARVVMGGMHASWLPDEALRHADQVIIGEGEKVILDVCDRGTHKGQSRDGHSHQRSGRGALSGLFHTEDALCGG